MCNSDFSHSSFESCRVILAFSHKVPICNVSAAVAEVFRPVEEISFDGVVTRAGVYINHRETCQHQFIRSIKRLICVTQQYVEIQEATIH